MPAPSFPRRFVPVAAALLLLAVAGSAVPQEPADSARPAVKLIVDYGDGVEKHFVAIPWRADLTVLDALKHCQRHPRGIQFKYRGEGETAFVTEIDDLANEGRGRNWTFRVNGEKAPQSSGITPLKAGDTVLWSFGKLG